MKAGIAPLAWSSPDAEGMQVALVGVTKRNPLGRRRWRRRAGEPIVPKAWPMPAEWQALLKRWLAAPADHRRWDTLLKPLGEYVQRAVDLKNELLANGWIEWCEKRKQNRGWVPDALVWRHRASLHAALGLPPPDAGESTQAMLRDCRFDHPVLDAAAATLSSKSTTIILRRVALLRALDAWMRSGREGTRREFAQHASGHTKSIGDSDWRWLEQSIDLELAGVSRHSPALWLRAPLVLHLPGGMLDLRAVPDLIGLSPATVAQVERIEGGIDAWRLVENRTSFEQAARGCGGRDAVAWLPGRAPRWWLGCVSHLLALCPAPARIACDPDPAGIEIATDAGRCWETVGQPWTPWQMDAAALHALPHRLPLNADDRERLARLLLRDGLPEALRALARAMSELDADGLPAKGEQEGLDYSRA